MDQGHEEKRGANVIETQSVVSTHGSIHKSERAADTAQESRAEETPSQHQLDQSKFIVAASMSNEQTAGRTNRRHGGLERTAYATRYDVQSNSARNRHS